MTTKAGDLVQVVRDEISRTKLEIDGIEMAGKPNINIFALQERLDVLETVLSKMLLQLGE